ncbi:hypothetical protein, partial [Mesorhizobium japonicum]|uniref:hypothetical protein n=1 Tax=Mesorhizobium japonicum TaxID=2066070 RepID=UPI003B59A8FB
MALLFMLIGLIINATAKRTAFRATGVALCFFLAASTKESAVALPFFLVIFDWFALKPTTNTSSLAQIQI